ncbi:MAG: FKBP-type peptidyl-prolyl cis-trans isomerase [Burkholderiaceae bacterium]
MRIIKPCVVALTWQLSDAQGEPLDEAQSPVEFFVGGRDLLASMEQGLQDAEPGAVIKLQLEPPDAFGDYNDQLVFLEPRAAFAQTPEPGMVLSTLPEGCSNEAKACGLLFVSDVYPALAGMTLRLTLTVHAVREATEAERQAKSTGQGFLTVARTEH